MEAKTKGYIIIGLIMVAMCALIPFQCRNLVYRLTGESVTGQVVRVNYGRRSNSTITVSYEVDGRVFTEHLSFERTLGIRSGDSVKLFYSASNPSRVTTGRPGIFVIVSCVVFVLLLVSLIHEKFRHKDCGSSPQ